MCWRTINSVEWYCCNWGYVVFSERWATYMSLQLLTYESIRSCLTGVSVYLTSFTRVWSSLLPLTSTAGSGTCRPNSRYLNIQSMAIEYIGYRFICLIHFLHVFRVRILIKKKWWIYLMGVSLIIGSISFFKKIFIRSKSPSVLS